MIIQDEMDSNDYVEDLTGEIVTEETELQIPIGDRVRTLRESKGLDLEELSNRTGFDVDFLADIEKKDIQPQLGTVIKLSKALDSAFGSVISGDGSKPYAVTRVKNQKIVQRSTGQKGKKQLYTYNSLAPEVMGRHMEAFMVTLEENPEGTQSFHDGEEFIYVIEGHAVVQIENDRIELAPGDSIYYMSNTPHVIAAKEKTAKILAVLYGG